MDASLNRAATGPIWVSSKIKGTLLGLEHSETEFYRTFVGHMEGDMEGLGYRVEGSGFRVSHH